jgi:hypothetical protein
MSIAHLVRPYDRQLAQEIGIDLVTWLWFRGAGPAIDRLDPHALHQRCDVLAADLDAFRAQAGSRRCPG